MGLILITHDMGVVADVADEICVMYAGRDRGARRRARHLRDPAHPYTQALLESIPRVDMKGQAAGLDRGSPAQPDQTADRVLASTRAAGFARDRARTDEPPLYDVGGGRQSACHYYEEVLATR